jgi:uncharacterized protein YbjT (DUF2867 family)
MGTVLVTGGTGRLGRAVVPALRAAGHETFALSRHPVDGAEGHGRRIGDLLDGQGVPQALRGVDTVVHLASSARHPRKVDVDGTKHLYDAAARAGVHHVVYMSIVGCDANPFAYYQIKAQAEQLTLTGPVPGTVLRATQFHELAVTLAQVAGAVATVRGRRPPRPVPLPVVGAVLRSFSEGSNLAGPHADRGSRTLESWLSERVSR